jgi:dTDP-4-amino-4,6-dideoxygalactose transaminase
MPGTNAKMNEMQALMGSLVLKYIDKNIRSREALTYAYRYHLKEIPGIHFPPPLPAGISYNHAYVVIEVDKHQFGMSRNDLYEKLKQFNIFTRRYFYPLICDYACYRNMSVKDPLANARRITDHILALPIYEDLSLSDVEIICEIIRYLHHQAWGEHAFHSAKMSDS